MKKLLFVLTLITLLSTSCTRTINSNGEIITEMATGNETRDSTSYSKAYADTTGYNKNIVFSPDGKEAYVYTMINNQPTLEYVMKTETES